LRLIQDCITRPLDFFLNTQFGFACLIEADKRDAGNNYIYNKEIIGEYFKGNFAGHLDERFAQFTPRRTLDALRTEMREEAAQNIRAQLSEGRRVFTLAAPTGAGKTMMLLALANEIRRQNEDLGVVYALPFLSITEQVEQECRKIWHDNADAVLRIDSKAENERVEKLQRELDEDPDKLGEMLRESFAEDTFDHPFIITTFVRLCETLVSNRNATLLKLPNFASTVFLLDEIQALPPRLYLFFVALLDEFCRRFDSYAVISTATMPYLEMPQKDLPPDKDPRRLFLNYQRPGELLEGRDYYQRPEFNRYEIVPCAPFTLSIEELAAAIRAEENSCLVILNTIDETKRLYDLLRPKQDDDFWREERYPPFFDTATNTEFADEVVLLNTHFTLEDRRWKLDYCKHCLDAKRKVVLISTQLIEAGVDIDFPTLYRDLCPLPSLIQSAGRCNRNGDGPTKGRVHLFELLRPDNKSSASLIYQDEPPWYLNFTKERITAPINEAELFALQLDFFLTVGQNLSVGQHQDMNLLECINRAECAKLGKFRLIDEKHFGVEYRYYVPIDEDDYSFADLQDLTEQPRGCDFAEAKRRQLAIASHIRKMASRIVTFRLNPNKPAPAYNGEVLDIRQLAQFPDYSSRKGIRTDASGGCFI
jgi:CRISPR-associated endonuclease/helicase Cas3